MYKCCMCCSSESLLLLLLLLLALTMALPLRRSKHTHAAENTPERAEAKSPRITSGAAVVK